MTGQSGAPTLPASSRIGLKENVKRVFEVPVTGSAHRLPTDQQHRNDSGAPRIEPKV